jgi:hypothetical protein
MTPAASGPRALLQLAALAGLYFLAGKLGLAVAFVHANASSVRLHRALPDGAGGGGR